VLPEREREPVLLLPEREPVLLREPVLPLGGYGKPGWAGTL